MQDMRLRICHAICDVQILSYFKIKISWLDSTSTQMSFWNNQCPSSKPKLHLYMNTMRVLSIGELVDVYGCQVWISLIGGSMSGWRQFVAVCGLYGVWSKRKHYNEFWKYIARAHEFENQTLNMDYNGWHCMIAMLGLLALILLRKSKIFVFVYILYGF